MKKEIVARFKKIFESQRQKIIFNEGIIKEDFTACPDDRFDEIDQATTDIEQSMRLRLLNRETLYIKKINDSLRRIEEGTFGECDDCGEEIELKRLEARPTATLCVFCKEEQERKEILTAVGREHKSLGAGFSKKYA